MGTGTPSMEEGRGTGGKAGRRKRDGDRDENRPEHRTGRAGTETGAGSRIETGLGLHRVLSGQDCGTGLGERTEGDTSKHRAELGKG